MTSPGTAIAPRPASLISPQTSSRADSGRSKDATLAPAAASPRAMPRPIPLAAPVTSAVCSSRRKLGRVMAAPFGAVNSARARTAVAPYDLRLRSGETSRDDP